MMERGKGVGVFFPSDELAWDNENVFKIIFMSS